MTTFNTRFDIEPVPASRPRIRVIRTKAGGTFTSAYYAGKYKVFMQAVEQAIPRAEYTHQGNLRVTLHCVVTKPKTTKRPNPNGDVDNYAKGVLDAMTKQGYWEDDMQIVDLRTIKMWATEECPAGILVSIEEVD